jgi:capsular polysaccharide biosynthesis protein
VLLAPPADFRNRPLVLPSGALESHVRYDLPRIDEYADVWFVPAFRAVYRDNGKLLHSSVFRRYQGEMGTPTVVDVAQLRNTAVSVVRALYGGVMYGGHYGHFLIETLSRLWPLVVPKIAGDISACAVLYSSEGMPPNQRPMRPVQMILEGLQLESRLSVLEQPVHVDTLVIPDQASVIGQEMFTVFRTLLRQVGQRVVAKYGESGCRKRFPRKIYLSRSQLPLYAYRRVTNEKFLERILEKSGFAIIHPQRLSLPEQIDMFSQAELIVGTIGSAFHTMLLADVSRTRILCLAYDRPDGLNTYTAVDRVCEADTKYIECLYPHPFCMKQRSNKDVIIDVERALDGIIQAS